MKELRPAGSSPLGRLEPDESGVEIGPRTNAIRRGQSPSSADEFAITRFASQNHPGTVPCPASTTFPSSRPPSLVGRCFILIAGTWPDRWTPPPSVSRAGPFAGVRTHGNDAFPQGAPPVRQTRRSSPGQPSRPDALPGTNGPACRIAPGSEPGVQPTTQDRLHSGAGAGDRGPSKRSSRWNWPNPWNRPKSSAASPPYRRRDWIGSPPRPTPPVAPPRPLPSATRFPSPADCRDAASVALAHFLAQERWPYTRRRQDRTTEIDLRPFVLEADPRTRRDLAIPPQDDPGRVCSTRRDRRRPWIEGPPGPGGDPRSDRRGTCLVIDQSGACSPTHTLDPASRPAAPSATGPEPSAASGRSTPITNRPSTP